MKSFLKKQFLLLPTFLFLILYQNVYSDNYYQNNLCDIDNNSKLSLSDIIYGLQVLSGDRNEEDSFHGISKTIQNFVDSLRSNSSNLSNSHIEKYFHTDFLHEGQDKNLFLSILSNDLRGESIPENFMSLNNIANNTTETIIKAVIKMSDGDRWGIDFIKNSETNEWLFFGDQNKYDYSLTFGITRTYPGGRIDRAVWVSACSWDIELVEVKVSGPIFIGWQKVDLNYSEQLKFFYTPTESISVTKWKYELWSASFGTFPPQNSEFNYLMNDGDKVEIFTRLSDPVINEALEGIGPTDYSIETVKGKEVEFSFISPQTFTVEHVSWEWIANDYGSWKYGTPTSETSAIFNFPTEIEIEGAVQSIDRIMVQARVHGISYEESTVYWNYGYPY